MKKVYDLFFEDGEVAELRAKGLRAKGCWNGWARNIVFGYFNDAQKMDSAVKELARYNPTSVYFTANPVIPSLLARANNRLIAHGDDVALTKNTEIVCMRWAMIDLDPRRPAGIPSTNKEITAAYNLADEIIKYLRKGGLRVGIKASSGNGIHLFYRFDPPAGLAPHTDEVIQEKTAPFKAFLEHLAGKFSNDQVEVDRGVYKPMQLARYYGTMNRKGDGTDDRPHRESKIIKVYQ